MTPLRAEDQLAVTALRILAIDQVERAKSGHPGLPLGAAPMAWVLWSRFLKHDPSTPQWPDRDRFVLSAGHGSALLYALLHLFGYDLSVEELRRFRQWGSRTPGHPEHGLTPGVETTTGPLGQGFANAVGLALAERHLAARFNRQGYPIVDHRTWVLASDGDLQEGVTHEAATLAGHWRLGRLVVLWDDNRITIEGNTSLAWSEEVPARFRALGWRTLEVDDGNDLAAIAAALEDAVSSEEAPVLVRVRTQIGFGSPHKAGTAEAHGAPLGEEEARLTRRALGWTMEEPFALPPEVYRWAHTCAARSAEARRAWEKCWQDYRAAHAAEAADLHRRMVAELPPGWEDTLPAFDDAKSMATRQASGEVLDAVGRALPELLGGSADLAPSNNSHLRGEASFQAGQWEGRNLHFGIREHAMAAICNGLSLHGGIRPYAATFLVFADYLRPALRLAALMHQPVIYLFTHDSVAVGEDGPTHQPVEHLAALRAIPNLVVVRPADAHETREAWRLALARRDGPTALILTRQKVPVLPPPPAGAVGQGAYVRAESEGGEPAVVLLASGSEVALALAAQGELEAAGVPTRVVSMPSWELFAQQGKEYQQEVLGPSDALRMAVELGRGLGWERWVGDGEIVSLEYFGASAPGPELIHRLGFSSGALVERVRAALAVRRPPRFSAVVPSALQGTLAGKQARLATLHAVPRLASRDLSLWLKGPAAQACHPLGWLDLPARTRRQLPSLRALVAQLSRAGARTLYLLGLGPGLLSPWVLRHTCGAPAGRELEVVDTLEPTRIHALLGRFAPHESAVLVAIPHHGREADTLPLLELFWEPLSSALGEGAGNRCVAIGPHGSRLERLASERRFAAFLPYPSDVGARFSAHTSTSVLPAVWLGLDAAFLLAGAERALELGEGNPATELAALLASVADTGWTRLVLCPSPGLRPLGVWVEQLFAGATGKDGRGVLPLFPTHPPEPAQARSPALFLSPRWQGEDTARLDSSLDALAAAGHPVVRWPLDPKDLGSAMATLHVAAALTALLLGVDPFAEHPPRARKSTMRHPHHPPAPTPPHWGSLCAHLTAQPGVDAAAVLAYLPERREIWEALGAFAGRLERELGISVTMGFAPRHVSTLGPLLVWGPPGLVPVVLTAEPAEDVLVPSGRETLGALFSAHALATLRTLADEGRCPLHVRLGNDPAAELRVLAG